MDKFILLFLLLLIFLNSINKKLLYLFLLLFSSLCIYKKKIKELFFILTFIYLLSYFNYETFQTSQSSRSSKPSQPSLESSKPSLQTTATILNNLVENDDNLYITPNNYKEITYVLKNLLESDYYEINKKNIETILEQFKIKNIYELSDKILNINKNQLYNNVLEKITCIKDKTIDFLDCNNLNFKKIYAFSELIKIYTISIQKVIELINNHKIYKLCDLSSNRHILKSNPEFGYEYDALIFYLNEMGLSDKYYKILELLDLELLLDNKNKAIPIKEKLYNYNDKNTEIVKDLNSIVILFKYYKIFDELKINNEEEDFNWDYSILRNIDLNRNYWEDNNFY